MKSETGLNFSSIQSQSFSKIKQCNVEEKNDIFRQQNNLFDQNQEICFSPQDLIPQTEKQFVVASKVVNEVIHPKEPSEVEEESINPRLLFDHFKLKMCSNLEIEMDRYKKKIKGKLDEEVIDFDEMLQKCQKGRKMMNEIKLTLSHMESQIYNFAE